MECCSLEKSFLNILAIHIPSVARQDELIWWLSKNGVFSVKSAYFDALRMHSGWDGVGEVEEVWRKVWGLTLPPKLALFLWKVLHTIVPTKVVLFRRGMAGDSVCPVCGQGEETVEHLFFECDFARHLWRASSLGLNFAVGQPVPFKEWLLGWVRGAPNRSIMAEGISVLWAIWRALNRLVFDGGSDGVEWGIQLAVSMRNDIWSCWWRAAKDGVGGQNGLSNQFVLGSCNQGVQGWIPKFLVDGTWCKQSLRGAVAWVSLSAVFCAGKECQECVCVFSLNGGSRGCFGCSSVGSWQKVSQGGSAYGLLSTSSIVVVYGTC